MAIAEYQQPRREVWAPRLPLFCSRAPAVICRMGQ